MTRIAILAQTIATADAVGNDVCGMIRVLAARGHEVRLYAENWNIADQEVWQAAGIGQFIKEPSDVVIYHHSIGWKAVVELLRTLASTRIIKYHNVTPAKFFAGISADLENRCQFGRAQLDALVGDNYDLYLSDSEFNQQELHERGLPLEKAVVVPPFHHTDRFCSLEPDLGVVGAYRDGNVNLLTVGRVSPNKSHHELIEAFANYHYDYNLKSRLFIVGHEDDALLSYHGSLRVLVSQLRLEEAVFFTGQVSDETLKSYYLVAHVFLSTSLHEGFCVPLIEAMAMKVPIVTYGGSAIPDTAGDAALVWPERNPKLLAESINLLVKQEDVRVGLASRGWNRYQQMFSNEKIEDVFITALDRFF